MNDVNLSYTGLTRFVKNPLRAAAYYFNGDKTAYDETSKAMEFGKLVHARLAAEGDIEYPIEAYARKDRKNGLLKAYSKLESMAELAEKLTDKLVNHDAANKNLLTVDKGHQRELSVKNDMFHGILDYFNADTQTIIDYKFVNTRGFDHVYSELERTFGDWIYTTLYHVQALVYLNIMQEHYDNLTYYIIAIDKDTQDYRIYDLTSVTSNLELIDNVNKLLEYIEKIKNGELIPEEVNDGSNWSIARRNARLDLDIEKPLFNGNLK